MQDKVVLVESTKWRGQGRTQNIFSGGAKPLLKNFLRISSIGKHILLEIFGGGGEAAPLAHLVWPWRRGFQFSITFQPRQKFR